MSEFLGGKRYARRYVFSGGIVACALALMVAGSLDPRILSAQDVACQERVHFYTAQWQGERLPDGRPKVPDDIVLRMRNVSIEEAWGVEP